MNAPSDVVDIVAEIGRIPRDRLTEDVVLGDVGLDSLALLEIALAIRKDLGVAVEDGAVADAVTVGDLIALAANAAPVPQR
jgi:acyl carrier protein